MSPAAALGFTWREVELLGYLLAGQRTEHIAAALGCATATVSHHLTHMYKKAAVSGRAELVARVRRMEGGRTHRGTCPCCGRPQE